MEKLYIIENLHTLNIDVDNWRKALSDINKWNISIGKKQLETHQ